MITDSIERIRAYIRRPDVRKKAFAEKAGLHFNTLQGVESDSWNPTAATIRALEEHIPDEGHAA